MNRLKPSVGEPLGLELKELPPHLEYVFLETNSRLPVFIASNLSSKQKIKLLRGLMKHKRAIAWRISYIRGINPSFCTQKILIEDDHKPSILS